MNLIDRISPNLSGNPRQQLIDCSTEAIDWKENLYYLIGGEIAKHEKQPDALKKIKNSLQSTIFELQSVVNGIY